MATNHFITGSPEQAHEQMIDKAIEVLKEARSNPNVLLFLACGESTSNNGTSVIFPTVVEVAPMVAAVIEQDYAAREDGSLKAGAIIAMAKAGRFFG